MSERLSAVEIEDVLSSIRRLVSEDLRPGPRLTADPSGHAAAEPAKPALILTPALRVVPDGDPPRGAALPVQAVVATVGAAVGTAVGAQAQEWEPETGDAYLTSKPVWADTAWLDPDVAVDGADISTGAGVDQEPGWAQSVGEEGRVAPEAQEIVTPAAPPAAPQDAPDAAPPAAPPDAPDAEWLAQAEAEVIAGLENEQAAGAPFDLSHDERELNFDEEVLRDLVRDLIREELQGPLGERITRNIRKLVRAEIARALAAADLE